MCVDNKLVAAAQRKQSRQRHCILKSRRLNSFIMIIALLTAHAYPANGFHCAELLRPLFVQLAVVKIIRMLVDKHYGKFYDA